LSKIKVIKKLLLIVEGSSSAEYLDPVLIANELEHMGAGAHEQYGLPTSIFWKLLLSFKENSTSTLKDRANVDSSQNTLRESKLSEHRDKVKKTQNMAKTNTTNDSQEKKKHTRRIKPSVGAR
jgi:hypothetical protein